MSKQEHAAEPWDFHVADNAPIPHTTIETDIAHIATVHDQPNANEKDANAARIVACVNGCANVNPEAVPDMLEALETVPNPFVASSDTWHDWNKQRLAAIAKAKQ